MSYPPIANSAELEIAMRLSDQGYKVLNRGWPDFLAIRGDELRFIEVKPTCRDRLSPHQKLIADALRKVGVVVEIAASTCVCMKGGCKTPWRYDTFEGMQVLDPLKPVHDGRHKNCLVCAPLRVSA